MRYVDPTGKFFFIPLLLVGMAGGILGGLGYYGIQAATHPNPCTGRINWDWNQALFWGGVGGVIGAGVASIGYGGWWVGVQLGWWGTTTIGTTGTTAATYACADGDCTNEISTGANVVYRLVENGTTRYVGTTSNFLRRAGEHLQQRGWAIREIPGLENLSRSDARAVEQVLIEHYGLENLYNQINSIAATNPNYQDAIQRGLEILRTTGFLP